MIGKGKALNRYAKAEPGEHGQSNGKATNRFAKAQRRLVTHGKGAALLRTAMRWHWTAKPGADMQRHSKAMNSKGVAKCRGTRHCKGIARSSTDWQRQGGVMHRPAKQTKFIINRKEENNMEFMKVRLTFTEEVLGTASNNPEIHSEFIASKAPDAQSMEEEIAAIGAGAVEEKSITVFPKLEDYTPFVWDYQIKGFFKDTCSSLRKVSSTDSSKIKAYKKEIDGLIFIFPRKIPFENYGGAIGECQRPLRGQTAQGERIALAHSETVQAGSQITFTVKCLVDAQIKVVREWLDYGEMRGLGQWRNSGKGRFLWDELDDDGNVIGGNNEFVKGKK